jgi:hypothetical protein
MVAKIATGEIEEQASDLERSAASYSTFGDTLPIVSRPGSCA